MIQGSPEWHKARSCKITASGFANVIAKPTTKRYQNYMKELAENITGVPIVSEEKPWFEHGKRLEPLARGMYEWEERTEVEEVPILYHPDFDFVSCSPDGLVGDNGGIEIKGRLSLTEYDKAKDNLPSKDKPQVQGCLWVSGRAWWDWVNLYESPETKRYRFNVFRVYPDLEYHKKLSDACEDFWYEVQKLVETLKEDMGV